MDVMLQRHCARYIYIVPEGLRELMSDISREVLRSQPEDMYTFIADYLDALLITRENARVSAQFVQYMTEASETIVDLLNSAGMTREEADRTATIIQEAFRAWSQRKMGILKEDDDAVVAKIIEDAGLSESQIQASAAVIQNAFKMYKARQQRESQLLLGIIDWRVAARSAIRLYRRSGVSSEEAKRAATLIKAAYKGYYTRRAMRLLNEPPGQEEESEESGGSEDTDSMTSEHRRSAKGVRIDYSSVVPHVDFGDEDFVSRDATVSAQGSDEALPPQEEMMTRIFEPAKGKTDEEFVADILRDIVDSVIGLGDQIDLPVVIEDKDSETDLFVPGPMEEAQETLYSKAVNVPLMSQEELEQELHDAKQEMLEIQKQASANAQGKLKVLPDYETEYGIEQRKGSRQPSVTRRSKTKES